MFCSISGADGRAKHLLKAAKRLGITLSLHQARHAIAVAGGYLNWPDLEGTLQVKREERLPFEEFTIRLRRALAELLGDRADSLMNGFFAGAADARPAPETAILVCHSSGESFLRFWRGRKPLPDIAEAFVNSGKPFVEFRQPGGRGVSLFVRMAPFKGQPMFVTAWTVYDQPLPELKHPLLDEMKRLMSGRECYWSHPAYRHLCTEFGFDPDAGRPTYWLLSDAEVNALLLPLLSSRAARRGSPAWRHLYDFMWFGIDAISGTEVDHHKLRNLRRLARSILEGTPLTVQQFGQSVLFEPTNISRIQIDAILLRRLCSAILSCENLHVDAYTVVKFLPSPDGMGCLSSIYGGCDPERGWYADIGDYLSRSVAVREPPDPEDLFEIHLQDQLRKAGVTLILPHEVEAYMADRGRRYAISADGSRNRSFFRRVGERLRERLWG